MFAKRVYRDGSCEHCGDQSQEALVVHSGNFGRSVNQFFARARSTFAASLRYCRLQRRCWIHFLSSHISHSLRFGVLGRSNYWPDTPGTTPLYARRTPYVHRISMVALPVCFLFRQATGTKVYLKSSRRHTVGLASSPQVGILAVGDVAFRIPLIVLVGGLQGTRCTRPPVSSKKIRSAVPALSFRRVTLQAVRAVSVRLPRSHFLLFG